MTSNLVNTSPLEVGSRTELFLRESYTLFHCSLKPPFPLAIPSPSEYTRLISAIAYAILTQPHLTKTHFTHLVALVTDGYNLFATTLANLVNESYPKLLGQSRIQLIWVCSKLVDVSAVGIENLILSLLRQINGGDFSDGNLWLSVELVKIFMKKWDWVSSEPSILSVALFTYLRLLSDHCRVSGVEIDKLKRLEIDFCIRVFKECFGLCLKIGRDLVRLLQDVLHIPEFRDLWNDLVCNPSVFQVPGFSDIKQIYHSRTSSRYFLLRIRPDMETELRFLLTHVKWGSQKRYQIWFAKKFLCGPERETIISDIIRFICCAHHPPNQIIQSNIISRWAVIGWLLKCCRRNQFEANSKLALFYDWLFFDEKIDNVMNIEPAILLMVHSIPQYADMTQNLMEFLFMLVDNYDVVRKDMIVQGVSTSLSVILKKGVVQSFEALTSCKSLSPQIKEKFSTFLLSLESGIGNVAPTFSPLQPMPPNLHNLSNVARGTSKCRVLGLPVSHERNELHPNAFDAAVKDSRFENSQPLILPSPFDVENRPQDFRPLGPSECHEKHEFQLKVADAVVKEAVKGSLARLPVNAPAVNLLSPTNAERGPAGLMELEPTIGNESSQVHKKAVGYAIQEGVHNALDYPSENSISFNPSGSSNFETRLLSLGKSKSSPFRKRSGIYAKSVDASIQETAKDGSTFLSARAMPLGLLQPSDSESRALQFGNSEASKWHERSGINAEAFHESANELPSPSHLRNPKCSELNVLNAEVVDATVKDNIQDASAYQFKNPLRSNLQTSLDLEQAKISDIVVEKTTRDSSVQVPLNLAPMSLLIQSNFQSRLPQSRKLDLPLGHTKTVDVVGQVSDNTDSVCSSVKTKEKVIDILENSVQELKAALEESMHRGLCTLEKILISYASLDGQESCSEEQGNSVFSSDKLTCLVTNIFKLNGYEMFIPFVGRSTQLHYDDEIQSATALVIRIFIFSPNERMKDLLLSWTRKGHAVGPRLLSYVSRLAYEAKWLCGLTNPTNDKKVSLQVHDGDLLNGDARKRGRESNHSELIDSAKSLLKCHSDGYISYLGKIGKESPNSLFPDKTCSKFVCNLVESAFIAYRGFLKFYGMKVSLAQVHGNFQVGGSSNSISCNGPKDMGPSLSALLLSDLKHCCQWKVKKTKLIFCSAFSYLSDLSTAREDFIRLMIDVLDHVDLISIQFEVGLKRFSAFGEDPNAITGLIKSTCYWDFSEQQKFWGLLISELAVSELHVEKIISNLCSGFLYISENSMAVEGLLKLLRSCNPTQELVATILSLPNDFSDFAAAVLASWAASKTPTFFDNLAISLENINNADGRSKSPTPVTFKVNHYTIMGFLSFLDNGQMSCVGNSNASDCCISKVKEKLYHMISVHGCS